MFALQDAEKLDGYNLKVVDNNGSELVKLEQFTHASLWSGISCCDRILSIEINNGGISLRAANRAESILRLKRVKSLLHERDNYEAVSLVESITKDNCDSKLYLSTETTVPDALIFAFVALDVLPGVFEIFRSSMFNFAYKF